MKAFVVSTNPIDGAEVIAINGHQIQFGAGSGGDGFCYTHQSFDCVDDLSDEENAAIQVAEKCVEQEREVLE